MQKLQQEHGYTLVLTLGIFVVFLILGVTLMTITMNGVKRNESREHTTQAQDLAVKGIDYVLKEIEYRMMEETETLTIGSQTRTIGKMKDGLVADDYTFKLTGLLNAYKCERRTIELEFTKTGAAKYCISNVDPAPAPNETKKIVTFKSTGMVKNKSQVVEASYEIGMPVTSTNMKYALLAYNQGNTQPGEINISGAVEVNGNVHADGWLYTSEKSNYKESDVPSLFPTIKGLNNTSALVEARQGFGIKSSAQPSATITPSANPSLLNSQFQKGIGEQFSLQKDIASMVSDKSFSIGDSEVTAVETKVRSLLVDGNYNNYGYYLENSSLNNKKPIFVATNLTSNASKVVLNPKCTVNLPNTVCNVWDFDKHIPDSNFKIYGPNTIKNISFPNDVFLQYGVNSGIVDTSSHPRLHVDSAYIGGNMALGLKSNTEVNFDLFDNILSTDVLGLLGFLEGISDIETPVEVTGNYYINQNLVINTARLKGNANFFVKGNTFVVFSQIKTDPSKKINIYSNGPVTISYIGNNHNNYYEKFNIKLDDTERSVWNGHIHSNANVTIDGATSYLTINGAITAPQINITSIKGRSEPNCTNLISIGQFNRVESKKKPGDYDEKWEINNLFRAANCFETIENQNKKKIDISTNSLIDLLGIPIIPFPIKDYPIEPRLIINYQNHSNFIDYNATPRYSGMEKPIPKTRN